MPAYLARVGVTVFTMLFAIALVTEHPAAGRALVVTARPAEAPIAAVSETDRAVAVAGFQALPPAVEPTDQIQTAEVVVAPAVMPAASSASLIVASGYGPGFYGNKTACGQIYSPQLFGVAHLTLPCGTQLTLGYGERAVTVPVIDRGPYIAGRTIDLSNATKLALGCADLCTLRMQVLR